MKIKKLYKKIHNNFNFNKINNYNLDKYSLINVDNINTIDLEYSTEIVEFYKKNDLTLPNIKSNIGIALLLMSTYKYKYFNRETINIIFNKFNINSTDVIQCFNKVNQTGILTNSGIIKSKYFIIYPYQLCNKPKMRKNFKYNGSENDKNIEINNIKMNILNNYININNDKWQLGHKNPDSNDNTISNLVLQPPIQAKYRDNYIFIDTLTKIPTPKKFKLLIQKKEINITKEQIKEYYKIFKFLLKK